MNSNDVEVRRCARREYIKYINKVMSAQFGDFEIIARHTCTNGEEKTGNINDMYSNCDLQVLRDARHNTECIQVGGRVMQCVECGLREKPTDVITSALTLLRDNLSEDDTTITLPLPGVLLDVAAYRFVYDMYNKRNQTEPSHAFWDNQDVRRILLHLRFDDHLCTHKRSCFKKGCECRFFFPFLSRDAQTHIYEDGNTKYCSHLLDGSITEDYSYVVELQRNQACQYINTHNIPVSECLNCNTNVQTGDRSHTFYNTLYTSKNTQADDCEPRDIIAGQLIRRLVRAQDLHRARLAAGEECEEREGWIEGLSRMLSGINAATSRGVVSAPMSHNLVIQNGERFTFSHEFADLLLGQMESVLDGGEDSVSFICRTCFLQNGTMKQWPDRSANDYIFRPSVLENICLYEQTMHYNKCYNKKTASEDDSNRSSLAFLDGHPGYGFAYLKKNRFFKIPMISMEKNKLCLIKDLQLECTTPDESTAIIRETYAKTALMLFAPFRKLTDLKTDDSYWATFDGLRRAHYDLPADTRISVELNNGFNSQAMAPDDHIRYNGTLFWKKGFDILHNIEDKYAVEESHQRAVDHLTKSTACRGVTADIANAKQNKDEKIKDILFYCDDDIDVEDTHDTIDEFSASWLYSHSRLLDQCNATNDRTVAARLLSDDSILVQDDVIDTGAKTLASACEGILSQHNYDREYRSIITLIEGTLLGGGIYDEVYLEDTFHENPIEHAEIRQQDSADAHSTTTNDMKTLEDFARELAHREGTILDKKQYMMYEILVCTFLLNLLCNEDSGNVHGLNTLVNEALLREKRTETTQLVTSLTQRGGREQLIMFVTGMAGAGKSTGIKVAQKYCFEFCRRASIMWGDSTFLFTAYTGSAAAAFGGLTTSSAMFLNKKTITDDDIQSFRGVRIIIIDEVSFMKDSELKSMDRNLKHIGDARKPFGGFNIVFGGDFQQLKPVQVNDKEILWHPSSSNHFENSLNCAIVLDGMHRFNDDKDYSNLTRRLCRNEMTEDDIKLLNTRVIGHEGLVLPKIVTGDTCYACPTNKERNSITAAIFKQHIKTTHPDVQNGILPPDHTIIIEAAIETTRGTKRSATMQSLRRRIIELGDNDVRCGTKLIDPCLRCYTGGFFMCSSNENLKDDGTGNGTQCRIIGIKLKQNQTSYRWKNWDGKKVWTVSAKDVEFVQFEHYPKTKAIVALEERLKELQNDICACPDAIDNIRKQLQQRISERRFKLTPQYRTCTVNVSPNDEVLTTTKMRCKILQLPVNASDAITGHKLQGLTKDSIIVYSWDKSTNWIYVVLSRVRTLSGLFLVRRLKLSDIKPVSRDYLYFLNRIRNLERRDIDRCAALAAST